MGDNRTNTKSGESKVISMWGPNPLNMGANGTNTRSSKSKDTCEIINKTNINFCIIKRF